MDEEMNSNEKPLRAMMLNMGNFCFSRPFFAVPTLVFLMIASPLYGARKKASSPSAAVTPALRAPIVLHVDMTDAPRKLIHAHLEIPVSPGPLTLEYPEWIPGDHRPTGPIDNLAGIFIRANGVAIPWQRDSVDMYAIHVDVPKGTSTLDVSLDFLTTSGGTGSDMDNSTSDNLAVLEWNGVVLYPAGIPTREIPVSASITLPAGWGFGTTLTFAGETPGNGASRPSAAGARDSILAAAPAGGNTTVSFATLPLNHLVDSPLITGRYFREFPLAAGVTPHHYLDVAADAPEDLDLKPETLTAISNLVREAGTAFHSRHYRTYHFLLSLSDQIRSEGLEHHESSDNGVEEHGFSDPALALLNGDLLPHEFTHSWNGKYRRPDGLTTPDFHTPQRGNLLWVYEGMTEYYGTVFAARSGFWTPNQYRQQLAFTAFTMDNRPGRTWRNVEDTAIASQILRHPTMEWSNWRLSQDYYPEGELIWLDVDTTIRNLTHGQKSLDDFAARFLGVGGNTGPETLPYSFDDLVAALNATVPYDWKTFLNDRLQSHTLHAPLDGISHGGYKLAYTDTPTDYEKAILSQHSIIDAIASLGLIITKDGKIGDVTMDSPADKAGLGPGETIVAINGLAYNNDRMKTALVNSKTSKDPIELIVSNSDVFHIVKLDYHGGERYAHLERVNGTPDLLDQIIAPRTGKPAAQATSTAKQ
jgi:predicted metalloprotease with PDZ domain